jgi:small subunit ribosomal protein S6
LSAEYELILMLDPEVADERRDEIAGNAKQRIETAGSLRHSDTWGVRKLAYEMKHRNEADYRFYRFEAEPPLLEDLDHTLKITDGILRFRLFKVDPRSPLIEPPAATQLGAGRREDRPRGRGPRRDDEGPTAEETPSAPEAPVSPETPLEPVPEPAPDEAPAPAETPEPAEEPAPAAETPEPAEEPVEEPAPAAEAEAPAEEDAAAEAEPAER